MTTDEIFAPYEKTITALRGAIWAQDEREENAGKLCGVPRNGSCDWPSDVAEEVLSLRAEVERLRELCQETVVFLRFAGITREVRYGNELATRLAGGGKKY